MQTRLAASVALNAEKSLFPFPKSYVHDQNPRTVGSGLVGVFEQRGDGSIFSTRTREIFERICEFRPHTTFVVVRPFMRIPLLSLSFSLALPLLHSVASRRCPRRINVGRDKNRDVWYYRPRNREQYEKNSRGVTLARVLVRCHTRYARKELLKFRR